MRQAIASEERTQLISEYTMTSNLWKDLSSKLWLGGWLQPVLPKNSKLGNALFFCDYFSAHCLTHGVNDGVRVTRSYPFLWGPRETNETFKGKVEIDQGRLKRAEKTEKRKSAL